MTVRGPRFKYVGGVVRVGGVPSLRDAELQLGWEVYGNGNVRPEWWLRDPWRHGRRAKSIRLARRLLDPA